MTVIEGVFTKAVKRPGIDCEFWFLGTQYRLVSHETAGGQLLGIDLTCPKASAAVQGSAASQGKWISGIVDCGIPLSSSMDRDLANKGRAHAVYGHKTVTKAATVSDAVLQMLVQRYEPDSLPQQKSKPSFLRILDGGMA